MKIFWRLFSIGALATTATPALAKEVSCLAYVYDKGVDWTLDSNAKIRSMIYDPLQEVPDELNINDIGIAFYQAAANKYLDGDIERLDTHCNVWTGGPRNVNIDAVERRGIKVLILDFDLSTARHKDVIMH